MNSDKKFLVFISAMLIGVVALCCWAWQDTEKKRQACEAKGGYFLNLYKSESVCLKSSEVLK